MRKKTGEEIRKIDKFFSKIERMGLALSYDDVRLKTNHSEILPTTVNLSSQFSKNVPVLSPIISSPMDTVTEYKMAIAMAKLGGLGVIHRGLSPKEQSEQVARVKFDLNGLIKKPICVLENETIGQILNRIKEKDYKFHSFPVLNNEGKLVGLLTNTDLDFCSNPKKHVKKVMSQELVTVKEGTTIKNAYTLMQKHKKKILPVMNKNGDIVGMYVYSDLKRIMTAGSPLYNLDNNGNLRVGAAIGTGDDAMERVDLLLHKGIDVVVIDTAHGDSRFVFDTVREIKRNYLALDVVVGNISESTSAKRLADVGVDGIKVGQGPGSICTTRIVAGIGCPQVSALYNCSKALRGTNIPICADGGIKYSGDIAIALAVGAHSVMLGNILAGSKETPGEVIIKQGVAVKEYRGMGSLGAMQASKASRERYGQDESEKDKLVPEGVEGIVPYKGEVGPIIFQCLGGLRNGMGYIGAKNILELHQKADIHRISGAGLSESHAHDLSFFKDTTNYSSRK
jgi:IMP dehydrogenase